MAGFEGERYAERYGRGNLALVGTGVIAVLLSFVPYYYTVSARVEGFGSLHAHINAWHSYAVLGMLLILAATALAAVRVFAPANLPTTLPVDVNLVVLGLSGLGTLLVVVRAFTAENGTGDIGVAHVSAGVGWSGWLLFVAAAAQVAIAARTVRDGASARPAGATTEPTTGPTG